MKSSELTNYIDKIKKERKMTQDELLFDVVSSRQYQRYKNDSIPIPQEVIIKIAAKLGLNTVELINGYQNISRNEARDVKKFMNIIISRNKNKFSELSKEYKNYTFINQDNKCLYEAATIFAKERFNKEYDSSVFDQMAGLVDYPNILKKDSITPNELQILGIMLFLETKHKRVIADKLSALLEDTTNLLSYRNTNLTIYTLGTLKKFYISTGNDEAAYNLNQLTIDLCLKRKTLYGLSSSYLFLVSRSIENKDNESFNINLKRLYSVLELSDDSIKNYHSKVIEEYLVKHDWHEKIRYIQEHFKSKE